MTNETPQHQPLLLGVHPVDSVSNLLNANIMTIEYNTDRDILIEVSNCFNHKHVTGDSAYRLLDKYLRHECGLETWEVDDIIDRLEERVTEHIIEIIESKQS